MKCTTGRGYIRYTIIYLIYFLITIFVLLEEQGLHEEGLEKKRRIGGIYGVNKPLKRKMSKKGWIGPLLHPVWTPTFRMSGVWHGSLVITFHDLLDILSYLSQNID